MPVIKNVFQEIKCLKTLQLLANLLWDGFKLHIAVNDKSELLDFIITQANVDNREPLKKENFLKKIVGKLYADKGYISKELTALLFDQGLHLVTGIRNNMKNVMMTMRDKILLRKRSVIETINGQL